MGLALPTIPPPFICIFCGGKGPFTSEEHIVPHSLGNDLVVLAKGWVCDSCNHIFSKFEQRVLYSSILGAERCRMGVVTKRGRPAHSKFHGVSWFAQSGKPNIIEVETEWDKIPVLASADGCSGKLVFRLHDETNVDIARLLLKIGVEITAPVLQKTPEPWLNVQNAKEYLLSASDQAWPYFILLDRSAISHLVSVFAEMSEEHLYICECGFDIFLHNIDDEPIMFFEYGAFFAAISLASPLTGWRNALLHWKVPHVGCPIENAHLHG